MKSLFLLILPFILAADLSAATLDPISLAGTWRFALDRSAQQTRLDQPLPLPPGDGLAQEWFKRNLADHIELPGILQAQGYGDEISPDTPWVLTLGDAWWKLQPAAFRDRFSKPGQVEVPFLAQPPKHYLGAAWYQRDVEIPEAWMDCRVALLLERPHWETTVWLDDRLCGAQDSLVAPHLHELGLPAPGKHRLTVRVDNRRLLADPSGDEHALDAHSVSDSLGATWNGIVGRIELLATAPVWIDDAQVFPNVAARSAVLKVRIGNATGHPGAGSLSARSVSVPIQWTAEGAQAELTVPLGNEAQTWDEFHPNLQRLTVTLDGEHMRDAKTVVFGLREITWKGKDLLANGHSINLRATHFGGDFPLTGYPATNPAEWKKIFQVCRDYGLNGMRFHSWCPPDAAFTAADEMGFYLQPECGMWHPLSPGSLYARRLEEETARLLRAYGNHPSFILLSPSNEPGGRDAKVTPEWAARNYRIDNRRLYSAGTGWSNPAQVTDGAQYAALVRFPGGELRNTTGWFGQDYRAALANVQIPVLAHEVGQWCAYPDLDVARKFTGYLRPGNYHIFQAIAEQQDTLAQNKAMARASGRFQVACYKEEIEANLRTPGLAGYQLLDLHDYLGQGTALIGVLDAFWESKGYVTAEEFHRFNGATIPLARLAKRVFTTTETLSADAEIYHFGAQALEDASGYWKIVGADGQEFARGGWPARTIPIGKNIELGKVFVDLSKFPAPAAYKLVIGLQGETMENDWNFWLYPAQAESGAVAEVLETSDWSAAAQRLARGDKVLYTPRPNGLDPAQCPPMKNVPVFWNIQMTVRPPKNPLPKFDAFLGLLCENKHPALAQFPSEANCDWQWTPLVNNVRAINLSGITRDLQPIVAAVDDWNRGWRLGVIFECKVGAGRLLVSAIPLPRDAVSAGSRQLRRSLLAYTASKDFDPQVAISSDQIQKLWMEKPVVAPLPAARVFDPDLNDGSLPPSSPSR